MAARSAWPSPSKSASTGLQREVAGCRELDGAARAREERPDAVRTPADVAVHGDGVGVPVAVHVTDRKVEGALVAAGLGAGGLHEDPGGPERVRQEEVVRRSRRRRSRGDPTVRSRRRRARRGATRWARTCGARKAVPKPPRPSPRYSQTSDPPAEAARSSFPSPSKSAATGADKADAAWKDDATRNPASPSPLRKRRSKPRRCSGWRRCRGSRLRRSLRPRRSGRERSPEDEGASGVVREVDLAARLEEEVGSSVPVEIPGAEDRRPRGTDSGRDPESGRTDLRRRVASAGGKGRRRRGPRTGSPADGATWTSPMEMSARKRP